MGVSTAMSGSLLPSFVDAVLSKRKLSEYASSEDIAFHASLKRDLQSFEEDMRCLVPHVEVILQHVVKLQDRKYSGMGWSDHWKTVSHDGYDVHKGRCVDYGNVEYYILLRCVCHMSTCCYECMKWLGDHHFGSLHPEAAQMTNHTVEMHGDVFEIIMAALRGHSEFTEVVPQGIIPLFVKLTLVCRTVHKLDACIRTGRVKWQNQRAPRLEVVRPDLKDHPFVHMWLQEDPKTRADALLVRCS